MYEEMFTSRLSALRIKKGVSARDMSLSLGQSAGYVNKIENGQILPSMTLFFIICEYLEITPQNFFDIDLENPKQTNNLVETIKHLDDGTQELLYCLLMRLLSDKK